MATLKDFVRQLKADCSTVEGTVLQQHLATEEELRAVRPGGKDNADRGPNGWKNYYRWLHRRHAVNEIHQGPQRSATTAQNDGLAMDALTGKPERLQLLTPIPAVGGDPERTFLMVYPKAGGPLVHCHLLSMKIAYVGAHVRVNEKKGSMDDLDLVQHAWKHVLRLQRQLAWIVTTKGSGLPFDRVETPDPDPPEWTFLLDALDFHRLVPVYQRVHGARLIALDQLAPSKDRNGGQSNWSTFAVGAAEALGISTHDVWEEMNFPSVVARLRVSSHAQRVAMDEAKERAEADRRR